MQVTGQMPLMTLNVSKSMRMLLSNPPFVHLSNLLLTQLRPLLIKLVEVFVMRLSAEPWSEKLET